MNPYKVENDIAYFNKRDVEDYGCPSHYGYTCFRVIENEVNYEYSIYDKNHNVYLKPNRAVHFYDRSLRFKTVVTQLLGYTLNVSKTVLQSEKWSQMCSDISELTDNYWKAARAILKKYKFERYYNSIPAIVLANVHFKDKLLYNDKDLTTIMREFKLLEARFKEGKIPRTYFPNLRYVALKIMKKLKIPTQIEIPLLITNSKQKALDSFFQELWGNDKVLEQPVSTAEEEGFST